MENEKNFLCVGSKNDKDFILVYIIEPGKFVYFFDLKKDKVVCTENILKAYRFFSRENCILICDEIQKKFGLVFDVVGSENIIVKVGD